MELDRVAHVQIFVVPPAPMKRVAALALQALEIDAAAAEEIDVFVGKIPADDADDSHGGEEARAHGEVGRRSAQDALGGARWRLDRIESDGADDEYAHLMYFPMIGLRSRTIFAGIFFRSVMIAFASAAPQPQPRASGEHALDLDIARGLVPAVVVGRERDRAEANLRLARELRLLKIGHADHIRFPAAIEMRLRARGELRPLHTDICPALMHAGALLARRAREGLGKLRTYRIGEAHVRDDAAAEKRARPLRGPVDELIGNDDVARRDLFLQAADGAHRNDALDAELLHGEDIRAEIDLG